MLFSSSRKLEGEDIIVFDIRDQSIYSAIVRFSKKSDPIFLYTKHFTISSSLKPAKKTANIPELFSGLSRAISYITYEGIPNNKLKKRPENVFFMISSPWCRSNAKTMHKIEKRPFVVNSEVLSSFLHSEEVLFEKSLVTGSINLPKGKQEIIERKIISTQMNGYYTENPYGKSARDIRVSLAMSLCPKNITEGIRSVLKKEVYAKKIEFHSSLIAYLSMILNSKKAANFVLTSIGADETEIIVMQNSEVTKTEIIPTGFETIVDQILAEMPNISRNIAISLLRDSAQKDTIDNNPKIREVVNDWKLKLEKILRKLSKNMFIPKDVFITTEQSFLASFSNAILEIKIADFTIHSDHFNVILPSEILGPIASRKDGEFPLLIDSAFLSLLWRKRNT